MAWKRGPQPVELDDVDVRDGQHPAAVVAARVIEHVQLSPVQTTDIGLDSQRPLDGVGQRLALAGSWFGERSGTNNLPPGHDNRSPMADLRSQELKVDRVDPRGQMLDKFEVGHEVDITAWSGVPCAYQLGRCGRTPTQ